jgi:hypothetical protein
MARITRTQQPPSSFALTLDPIGADDATRRTIALLAAALALTAPLVAPRTPQTISATLKQP